MLSIPQQGWTTNLKFTAKIGEDFISNPFVLPAAASIKEDNMIHIVRSHASFVFDSTQDISGMPRRFYGEDEDILEGPANGLQPK